MTYLKDFQSRIAHGDYPGFLKIWEEYCYGDQPDGEEILAILESMKSSDLAKHFGIHVERILPLWELISDTEMRHNILRLLIDLQTTQSESLADLATEHLKNRHPKDPLLLEKLRLVGLRSREHFSGAIRNFELLTHMEKGNFVFHTAGWGTGEILDVSLVREELKIEFEHILGAQHFSFEKAFKTLLPLSKEHFYARRFGDPDTLEAFAKEHPVETLHLLLRDIGPKTAAEIKDELFELVISEKEWNRWWQNTRAKLKKDTKIETPKDSKGSFILRDKELPHEVAFHKALEEKPAIHSLLQMVHAFLRDFPETLKNEDFKQSLVEKLQTTQEEPHISETQKLQLLFFLEDLGEKSAEKESLSLLKTLEHPSETLQRIDILTFQKRAIDRLEKIDPTWEETSLSLLVQTENNLLRDYLLSHLSQKGTPEKLRNTLSKLHLHPTQFPEAFLWYFQKITDTKSKLPFSDTEGRNRFFESLFVLLDHTEKKNKEFSKKILTLLLHNRYKLVRDIFQHSSQEELKEYLLLASKCQSFTDHDLTILQSLAEVVHPSLSRLRKGKEAQQPTEDVLWTTQEGYKRTQARIEEIATVETVQNAKEIEAARALGDLRENAEFKAALEKRARLQGELKFLSDQIGQARIITPEDISLEEVGIGNIVFCKTSHGESCQFTLLGPWDAKPEERILSFQSKFAQAMRGKTVGDTFSFQGETFTIQSIKSYIELQR